MQLVKRVLLDLNPTPLSLANAELTHNLGQFLQFHLILVPILTSTMASFNLSFTTHLFRTVKLRFKDAIVGCQNRYKTNVSNET